MIVEASAAHAAVIAAMHAACFAEAWAAPEIARLMAMQEAITLIAEAPEGGAPRGFLIARRMADEAEILTLATLPASRRLGVARSLVGALAGRLAAERAALLHIEVAAGNEAALALYRSLGFEVSGLRRGYYALAHGGSEDAILMRLPIPRRVAPAPTASYTGSVR